MKKIIIIALSLININSYAGYVTYINLENNNKNNGGKLPMNSIIFKQENIETAYNTQAGATVCEYGIGAGQVISQWREPISNGFNRIYWRNNTITLTAPAGSNEYTTASGTKYVKSSFKQSSGLFNFYEICQIFGDTYNKIWIPKTEVLSNWKDTGKYYNCGSMPTTENNLPYETTLKLEHCYSEQEKITVNKEIVVDTSESRVVSTNKEYKYINNWITNNSTNSWTLTEDPYNCESQYPMENTIEKGVYYEKTYVNCTVSEKELLNTSRTNIQMNYYTETISEYTGKIRIESGRSLTKTAIGTK